ncbi:type II toxin-antitoxin system prevent-host-death family antitoxin, partial [Pseudomonas aeruginosa]
MRTISYTEARQNLSATMMKTVEDRAPILITRQNGEACVLIADSTPFGHSAHADPDTCSTLI